MERTVHTKQTDSNQRTAEVHGAVQRKQLTPDEVTARYGQTLNDWHQREAESFVKTVSQSLRLVIS